MPPKDPELNPVSTPRTKPRRSKAVRRLVIWYRRNAAVTTIVDSATSSANVAGSMAGTVAESVVSGAGTVASSVLQPLVFDPLRRLLADGQGSDGPLGAVREDTRRQV